MSPTRMGKAEALLALGKALEDGRDSGFGGTSDSAFAKWRRDTEVAIRYVFGEDSRHVKEFTKLHFSPMFAPVGADYIAETFRNGLGRARSLLESMMDEVRGYWEDDNTTADQLDDGGTAPEPRTDKVFIVHGRDNAARSTVARFIDQLDIDAVILSEQPSEGRTIIEKFEAEADVGFAIVILTPDDEGGLQDSDGDPRPRARQNVVFEMGFFVGKLGRKRVCALKADDVEMEIPSDYAGVVYIPFGEGRDWRLPLAIELRSAGFDVDLNKLA